MKGDNRSQAFTLEAFFAALIILSSIVFALQAIAITPLTSSTSSQQIQNQQSALADGFLAIAEEENTLKNSILHWNAQNGAWNATENANQSELASGPYNSKNQSPEPIREQQYKTFGNQTAVNIQLFYYKKNGEKTSLYFQDEGLPTENTVTVERQVVLYDDDRLTRVRGGEYVPTKVNVSVANSSSTLDFYAPDVSPNTEYYNTVTVEVTVWRI